MRGMMRTGNVLGNESTSGWQQCLRIILPTPLVMNFLLQHHVINVFIGFVCSVSGILPSLCIKVLEQKTVREKIFCSSDSEGMKRAQGCTDGVC